MVIWGSTVRFKTISEGVFFCPHEGTERSYLRLAPRRWFTVFWFPLIPLRRMDEVIRCDSCGRAFTVAVLESVAATREPNAEAGTPIQVPGRFSPAMLVLPAIALAIVGVGWANRGTTATGFLGAGDCFVMTDTVEVERLETPDCSELHDSQIIALVELPQDGPYPPLDAPYWETVFDRCATIADSTLVRFEELPDDTVLDFMSPTAAGWDEGDRESICFIHSPAGLAGSFMP